MKTTLTLAALAGAALFGMAAPSAQALPLAAGLDAGSANVTPVQFREVRKFNRINRRGQFCRVKVVRRYTPRGVVVRRVRNCM